MSGSSVSLQFGFVVVVSLALLLLFAGRSFLPHHTCNRSSHLFCHYLRLCATDCTASISVAPAHSSKSWFPPPNFLDYNLCSLPMYRPSSTLPCFSLDVIMSVDIVSERWYESEWLTREKKSVTWTLFPRNPWSPFLTALLYISPGVTVNKLHLSSLV